MPDTLVRAKLGAEYRGLGRAFRAEVKRIDAETERALAGVIAPIKARLAKHRVLRPEQVMGTLRVYGQTVPTALRIGQVTVVRDRANFALGEVRLIASWLHQDTWQGDDPTEQGIAVARYLLRLHAGRLRVSWEPVALVSLHSLGRHFERTGNREHRVLYRDLAVLAAADPEAARVPAGDGFWVGGVMDVQGEGQVFRTRNVRTWHA